MNLKFNILFGVQVVLAINFVFGQSRAGDPVTLTLEECLNYAFENSDSIKNAIIDQKIAKAQVGRNEDLQVYLKLREMHRCLKAI